MPISRYHTSPEGWMISPQNNWRNKCELYPTFKWNPERDLGTWMGLVSTVQCGYLSSQNEFIAYRLRPNLSEIIFLPVHMPFVKQPALPLVLAPLFPSSLKNPECFYKAGRPQAIPGSPARMCQNPSRGLFEGKQFII